MTLCGIAGMIDLNMQVQFDRNELKRMCDIIIHRGPDDEGYYLDSGIALGIRRLSIIDVEGGHQPIHNEDKNIWIIFNGEIFNFQDLRDELAKKGHLFYTRTDTEVIVHLYEQYGLDCLQKLNGQFAFLIWDKNKRRVFIARDRMGIKPFFYAIKNNILIFGSEIKSILTNPDINREIDVEALSQVFYAGYVCAPKTMFVGINSLKEGHLMLIENRSINIKRYWDLQYPKDVGYKNYRNKFLELIEESTKLRLISDVPVGGFLSGGLDSSTVCNMVKKVDSAPLKTFSLRFADKHINEIDYAVFMAKYLGTEQSVLTCSLKNLAPAFPKFIWHSEMPVLATENISLMLLYELARTKVKVILTGEGADELFGGYNLLLWDKIYRQLNSYPWKIIKNILKWYNSKFIGIDSKFPSEHELKIYNKQYGFYPADRYIWDSIKMGIESLCSRSLKEKLDNYNPMEGFLPDTSNIKKTNHLNKLIYYGCKCLLANYVLGPHGDRIAMSNSVEARYPFLDHKLVEFAASIPPHFKIRRLTGKYLVRKSMEQFLPKEIVWRKKKALRTPVAEIFLQKDSPKYIKELLSYQSIKKKGYFNPEAVLKLTKRITHRNLSVTNETKGIALVEAAMFMGVLSTQLFDEIYIKNFYRQVPIFR